MKNILMIATIFLLGLTFNGCQDLEQECKEEKISLLEKISKNDNKKLIDSILLYEKKCKDKIAIPKGDTKPNPKDDKKTIENM